MIAESDICSALCAEIKVQKIPIGRAIRTPFLKENGDPHIIYARTMGQDKLQFEDDGETFAYLSALGIDFSQSTRWELLAGILEDHNIFFDEVAYVFHSRELDEEEAPLAIANFVHAVLRIYDIGFLSRETVRRAFLDDLVAAITEEFSGEAEILLDAEIGGIVSSYPSDVLLKHRSGIELAIFGVVTETKALRAILTSRDIVSAGLASTRVFVVMETPAPRLIPTRTLSTLMNSDITLSAWENQRAEVLGKMHRAVANAA